MNEKAMNPAEHFKSLTWIESTGRPLLLLEKNLVPLCHGSLGKSAALTDSDRACKVDDYAGAIEVGPGFGLVLGEEPCSTTWWRSDNLLNSFLVRWVYAADEAQVRAALSSIQVDNHWQPTDVRLDVANGEPILFDSACPGTAIDTYLTIDLPLGCYGVDTLHYDPPDELSLILHRFVPGSSAATARTPARY